MIARLRKIPLPWLQDYNTALDAMQDILPCKSMAVAILDGSTPTLNHFLTFDHEQQAEALAEWCESDHSKDSLFKQALTNTVATNSKPLTSNKPSVTGQEYVALITLPLNSHDVNAGLWLLAVGRPHDPFTDAELSVLQTTLRLTQIAFDHVPEPGVGRLLINHQGDLLHADPCSHLALRNTNGTVAGFTQQLASISQQRWPDLRVGEHHDIAVDFHNEKRWVRFTPWAGHTASSNDSSSKTGHDSYCWFVDVRSLDETDVPTVGLVDDNRVALAIGHLDDHFAKAPSLNDIADAVQTSSFHFHRLFSKSVGVSPKHYLLRKQLQMAKWMLASSSKPIGDVASDAGFASHGHFTATFHRTIGRSPREYREQF